ncbi:MAG TPA: hypothetical protein VG939_08760, partial [Caulobacteraceae bacterium]|nr:hypothetical protein [Caulobacteraceae bacterium]
FAAGESTMPGSWVARIALALVFLGVFELGQLSNALARAAEKDDERITFALAERTAPQEMARRVLVQYARRLVQMRPPQPHEGLIYRDHRLSVLELAERWRASHNPGVCETNAVIARLTEPPWRPPRPDEGPRAQETLGVHPTELSTRHIYRIVDVPGAKLPMSEGDRAVLDARCAREGEAWDGFTADGVDPGGVRDLLEMAKARLPPNLRTRLDPRNLTEIAAGCPAGWSERVCTTLRIRTTPYGANPTNLIVVTLGAVPNGDHLDYTRVEGGEVMGASED